MDFDFPELSPAVYDEVRRRVLKKIRRQKRVRNAVRAMAACAALVIAGLFALWPPARLPAPPMLARVPGAPPRVPTASVVRHRQVHRRREEQPAQPLEVRLETDDPNVVILWTVD